MYLDVFIYISELNLKTKGYKSMISIKNNTQTVRKADINALERRLLELQEKYNLEDEAVEKILIFAK